MSKVWQCLEDIHGLVAVPVTWRSGLAGSFEVFKAAFLRTRTGRAKSFPCPNGCGCAHEIVEHQDGSRTPITRDYMIATDETALRFLVWANVLLAVTLTTARLS